MKRPKEVAKAKAVARTAVAYCSGSQRLKVAKLPPKKPRKNSTAMKGTSRQPRMVPIEAILTATAGTAPYRFAKVMIAVGS